ncbi:cadmium resistance transporter [Actinacidiphila glaucinigra]|uniref:cadmium resistance transporter n=1 Tax=Actinacidiphila glaucinigra TaxID=235986 RepID=UPI0037C64195
MLCHVKAAWQAWKDHRDGSADEKEEQTREGGPGLLEVAAAPLPHGGDNIGVHVPVFATAGVGGTTVHAVVFLVLVAVWFFAGKFFAARPAIAKALTRWGHILLPLVLIAIGLLILVEGGVPSLLVDRARGSSGGNGGRLVAEHDKRRVGGTHPGLRRAADPQPGSVPGAHRPRRTRPPLAEDRGRAGDARRGRKQPAHDNGPHGATHEVTQRRRDRAAAPPGAPPHPPPPRCRTPRRP